MKPFNLEEAKAGKPVCTLNGKEVKILDYDFYTHNYQDYTKLNHFMVVKIKRQTDDYIIDLYRLNGLANQDGSESERDLFMVTEKHEGWGWASRNNTCVSMFAQIYETKEEALGHKPDRGESFLAKVEWEE